MEWATAFAATIQAAVSAVRGETEDAVKLLVSAQAHFKTAEMPIFAAACSRHVGAILRGNDGQDMIRLADGAMAAQNIQHPERFAHLLVPGFRA
jgi:hypothetical protein